MPTYDYQCDACGHRYEQWQSFADAKLTTCPSCGAESLRRLFGSGAAILFKGSGFYETDYRRPDADRKAEQAGKKSGDPDAPKAETKSDGKSGDGKSDAPAAKADAGKGDSAPASPPPAPPPAAPAPKSDSPR